MSDEKKLAIIATKGTLDWAYPPFILASTAAALGYDTQIFFTFYGLQLLKKDLNLKVSPLGNPGMPMPMGMDKWFPTLGTALPGMESMMSSMMKSKMKSKGVASVAERFYRRHRLRGCHHLFRICRRIGRQPVHLAKISSNNSYKTSRTRGGICEHGST